jgi:hypothetical protein
MNPITNVVAAITISLSTNWVTTEIITPVTPPNPAVPIIRLPPQRLRQRMEVLETHVAEIDYLGKHFRFHVATVERTNNFQVTREITAPQQQMDGSK